MGLVSPAQVTDGSTADASDVNTPINQIANEFNGNIDNANIKTAAAIDGSKIASNSLDLGAKASTWDGWISVSDSWTYGSATTITVPSDATTKYSVGDKIKCTNSGTKYFYVTAVSATTLTVSGGSDYTVANAAISGISYSKVATPLSFPQWFNYTTTTTGITTTSGTLTGKFTMLSTTVFFKVKFTLGASSAITGSPTFTLPTTTTSFFATNQGVIGHAEFADSGVANYTGSLRLNSTTVAGVLVNGASGVQTAVSSTVPFTFGTADSIIGIGHYETA